MNNLRTISEQELRAVLGRHAMYLRSEEGGQRAVLCGVDLRGFCLVYADLREADLSHSNLTGADLRHSDLRDANLRDVNFRDANLMYANLSGANLRCANLNGAELRNSDLLTFQFNKHQAYFTLDGTFQIGNFIMPISEWLLGFEELCKYQGYSEIEVQAYGKFIKMCAQMFEAATFEPEEVGAK